MGRPSESDLQTAAELNEDADEASARGDVRHAEQLRALRIAHAFGHTTTDPQFGIAQHTTEKP